ncbi:helix-turn-helix domain-containing protein [Flavobacterium sp.]|uniref:helix-turn-helix domain-containing protein n=1 Tax=Flavobacterium sp. TaxID=239 RepID=UPI0039E23B8D
MLAKRVYFLLLLCSGFVSAQRPATTDQIDKEFERANLYVNTGDPEQAIPLLEKIEQECERIGYKQGITKVGHTLAIIYFNTGNYKKVITLDDVYLKTGIEIEDYAKLSHIHRLKGCAYSELGLLDKGGEELLQALKYAKRIAVGNKRHYAMSLIYSNRAGSYIKGEAIEDSIFSNINKSIAQAEQITEQNSADVSSKYSLISYSYMILANEHSKLQKARLAEDYYLRALEIHNGKPTLLVERVVLLSQLGFFYYKEKQYDKAIKYAELGMGLEKQASFPQIRRDLFETLSKSYLELNKTENSKKYLGLFTALNDSINSSDRKAVDTALTSTVTSQKKKFLDDAMRKTLMYISSSIVLMVLGASFFFHYKRKKQNQIKKIESILEKLKERHDDFNDVLQTTDQTVTNDEKEGEKIFMPAEAEKNLIEKLHHFEEKKLYLERKVSLSFVAAEIESNTRYLSYIIKKHKGKDFNKYINDLRINYIVQKINDNPLYRQYKINVLAEEAGFSSHSKFGTVFKNTVGVSPSEFIHYFEKNKGADLQETYDQS